MLRTAIVYYLAGTTAAKVGLLGAVVAPCYEALGDDEGVWWAVVNTRELWLELRLSRTIRKSCFLRCE